MIQKYYSRNSITNYIKNLLYTTYIPNIPIWGPGKPLIENGIYLTNNYIVKARKPFPNSSSNSNEAPLNELDGNYFDIINKHIRNSSNGGLCTKYNSPYSYYDTKTHYYLGQYLRMQRDMFNINLMPFYNCWCGEYNDNIRIKIDSEKKANIYSKLKKDGLKVLQIPIKYNQKYTIYINSNYPLIIVPAILTRNEFRLVPNISPLHIDSCNFNQPILYNGCNIQKFDNNLPQSTERNLYLLIQTSDTVSSHTVVLEGDYKDNKLINIGNFGNISGIQGTFNKISKIQYSFDDNSLYKDSQLIDNYCRVCPNLLRTVDNVSYAFDDRLIEFLLGNVITNKDKVWQDISRVQNYLFTDDNTINNKIKVDNLIKNYPLLKQNYPDYLNGVWDNKLRAYLYDLITQHWKTPKTIGITGYVDKDIESILGEVDK